MTQLLTTNLAIAPSQLYVADLEGMTKFYRDLVGLTVLESSPSRTLLGDGSTGSIELISTPRLAHASPRSAGLFHNAILFSTRGALARSAGRVASSVPQLFTGTGDHLVSEAFYFDDPEGNGVELYYDRPKETWQWDANGHIRMDTLYIDPLQYISSHASEYGPHASSLGHVHLRVGDITTGKRFYIDVLGFAVTAELAGSALFMSVAGYHHHIALNTWLSQGADKRLDTLGLSAVTLHLDSDKHVAALAQRLEDVQHSFTLTGGILTVADPWNNTLVFTGPHTR